MIDLRQAGAYRMVFGGVPPDQRDPPETLLPEAVRRERLHDTLCELRELSHSGDNWLPRKDIDIAKSYVAGDIYLCLIVQPGNGSVFPQVGYCYAFIQPSFASEHDADFGVGDMQVSHQHAGIHRAHWDKTPVFVDVAEPTQCPEGRIPSFVRFEVHDHLLDIWRDANHFSFFSFDGLGSSFDVVGGFPKGEVNMTNIIDASASGYGHHQLVESGPQVVNGLRDEKEKTVGNASRQLDLRQAISALRITLYNKSVGLTFEQGNDFPFHLVDVIIGPANFNSRTA